MERSRKRTPIIQRSKGACTIGLVITLGCAVFGVGGAAAGDGSYARHVHAQKLAGIALAHRTPEQLLLAMRPKAFHASVPAATAAPASTPAPPTPPAPPPASTAPAPAPPTSTTPAPTSTTPPPASTTPTTTTQPAPPTPPPASTTPTTTTQPAPPTPAPPATTTQPATTTTTTQPATTTTTTQPATTTTQPATPSTTTQPATTTTATQPATPSTATQPTTTTATQPATTTTTTTQPATTTTATQPATTTGPDNSNGNGNGNGQGNNGQDNGNGNNGQDNGNGNADGTTVTPALQISATSPTALCRGRCSTQSTGVLPASLPSTSSSSVNVATAVIPDSSVSSTATPTAVAITALPSLTPTPAPTSSSTPPNAPTSTPITLNFPTLPSASRLRSVAKGNSPRRSPSVVPTAGAGTGAVTATGTTGGPTAPAAGTLIASAPAAGATASTTHSAGKHSAAGVHSKTKQPAPSSFLGPVPLSPAAIDHFITVIPTWIKVALGVAVALALAFAGMALRSARRAKKQATEFAAISAAAQTDPLTGILNRRGFMDAADRELARASRYERPFVLAYVDVRGLKTVNDTEGHLVGDELIKAVAGLMKESARADDIVGRIGGDEFALLLAEQTVAGAAAVMRRINARVDERRAAMEIRVPWELTIGVAAFPEDGASLEDLIGVADRRLYEQRGIALR